MFSLRVSSGWCLVPGDTDQLLSVSGLQSKQFSHRGWEPSPPRTKHHPGILINRLDQHCKYATIRRMKTQFERLCDGRYLDRALILTQGHRGELRWSGLASLCIAAAMAVTCHVSRHLVTVTRLYPDPGPSSLTVLVQGSSAAVLGQMGQRRPAEWMNYKSCVGQKPTRNGAQRTLPLQSTVSTQHQRVGARCHDAGHGVHLGSGAAAGCCAAARICTITTTAQPRPGRGLRKFGSEQRSGIARPGATSPRAAPCHG